MEFAAPPPVSTGESSGRLVIDGSPPTNATSIERMLQINVALLIVLGTSLLAMGQQNIIYALIATAAAAASVFITDMKGWFRLSQSATTTASLLACVILVIQVIRNVDQSHLLNVANVLIYLETILLFQQKDDRTYWSLMALSLLQVVVAVALNLGLLFGMLLGVYVLAALGALVLFYVVRETRPFVQEVGTQRETSPVANATDGSRLARLAAELPGASAGIDSLEFSPLSDGAISRVLQPSLVRHLLRMLVMILAGTFLVFFAIPRYGESVWQSGSRDQVTTTGFTEEVQLDNIGLLLENPEQVMRVEFTTLQGEPYQVDTEPYFRGSVLSEYRGRGLWKPSRMRPRVNTLESQRTFDLAGAVLQRITLQQGSHSVLFNVAPSYYLQESPRGLFINTDTRQLMFGSDQPERRGTFRYTLGTTALRNGWQRDLMPAMGPPNGIYLPIGDEVRNQFSGLTALADQTVAELGPEASVFDRAKALESHFRSTGLYRYSLEVNRQRDRGLDPMEDFVVNHRTGHCEYFAGALTLMLRSQNIPARMVVGFKGGEYNTVGNYYIVRQLHAHAWVEAYLAEDDIPVDEWDVGESRENGAWLRLDPTPGGLEIDVTGDISFLARTREFFEYLQVLWDDYVLGLNATRQQQMIYAPLAAGLRSIATALFSPEVWMYRWLLAKEYFQRLLQGQLISLPTFMLAALTLTGISLVLHRSRARWQAWLRDAYTRLAPARVAANRAIPQLHVYAKLEHLLELHGWRRPAPQTPDEFAREVGRGLVGQQATAAWAEVPGQVTNAYYRVRYGAAAISLDEHQRLLESVHQLEQALMAVKSL